MKCEGCKTEKGFDEIKNYVVRYESWEAFNCCCKECAKESILRNGIIPNEIISIE